MSVQFRVMRLARPSLPQPTSLRVDLVHDMAPDSVEALASPSPVPLTPFTNRAHLQHPTDALGLEPMLEMPQTLGTVFLGETFSAFVTLGNLTGAPMRAVAVKVELSMERPTGGASAAVLHDSSPSPLPTLPSGGRHDLRVSSEVRELGTHTLACSAVYTGADGERQYHVQFFRWAARNPLAVRTKLRSLSFGRLPPGGAAMLLEVAVENLMPCAMLLPAVKFLAVAGLAAALVGEDGGGGGGGAGGAAAGRGGSGAAAAQAVDPDGKAASAIGAAEAAADSDTATQRDAGAEAAAAQAPGSAPAAAAAAATPLAGYRAQLRAVPPEGGTRHFLWQLRWQEPAAGPSHDAAHAPPATLPAAPPPPALGHLEVHWRGLGGAAGRLQTQPILALPLAGAGREARLRLGPLPEGGLHADVPVWVTLRVARAAGAADPGPLRVVYSEAVQELPGRGGARADGAGTAGGGAAMPGILVVGPRSVAVPPTASPGGGGEAEVKLQLVPVRRGVQRLPAFLVVAERDGRPIDSVHDVQVLVW